MTSTRPRTRLSPEARKDQLLNTAKIMIVEDGLQRFTMESLTRTAGVSSPLVYNYFASREDLLRELLVREHTDFAQKLTQEVGDAKNFEEIVRVFITSNFDHHAPGNILPILQSQPEIARVIEDTLAKHGRQIARFLIDNTARSYQLTKSQAGLVVSMSSGASIAAAQYSAGNNVNRDKAIDTALSYVLAGLDHIAVKN